MDSDSKTCQVFIRSDIEHAFEYLFSYDLLNLLAPELFFKF